MNFKIGDKLNKYNYTLGALWCNAHNAFIEKVNGDYIIQAIPEPTETETLENDIAAIDQKIQSIENKVQRSLLDVVIGSIFPLELTADDKKENAESKKYLLQYWKDKKELRRQRVEKLKRIEALKNVISR